MTTAAFTAEQHEIRGVLREALEAHHTDASLRSVLSKELGLLGLLVPAPAGGLGLGPVELLVVAEELGRALRATTFLPTGVLGATLLCHAPEAPSDDTAATIGGLLDQVVAGDHTLALIDGADLRTGPAGSTTRLTGANSRSFGATEADTLLVVAGEGDEQVLVAVPNGADGVVVTPLPCLDDTRDIAAVSLHGAAGAVLARGPAVGAAVAQAHRLARLYVAAEAVGGAQWCLTAAVDYAKIRHQFGRPIGSFQAIKHLCADLLVELEGTKSILRLAADTLYQGAAGADVDLDLALLQASEGFHRIARGAMHIFGGIGFTWEHPAHRYVKRALTTGSLLEPLATVRARVAAAATAASGGGYDG